MNSEDIIEDLGINNGLGSSDRELIYLNDTERLNTSSSGTEVLGAKMESSGRLGAFVNEVNWTETLKHLHVAESWNFFWSKVQNPSECIPQARGKTCRESPQT